MKPATRDFQIYVMCGVPGCGKSTFAEKHFPDKPIISRDAIRLSVIGNDEEYFSHENEVYSKFIESIVHACNAFGCCVVDATHISIGSRRKLFNSLDARIKNRYSTYMVCFDPPLKTCVARNNERTGRAVVPREAIENMYENFKMPTRCEHDSILEVWKVVN